MEIKVLTYSKNRESIEKVAKFYAKQLNLTRSKYKVFICTDPDLRKENGAFGLCGRTGEREITISLYSRLSFGKMLYTLAHEMTHVKQFAKGQYRSELAKNGRHKRFWLGKRVTAKYEKRPWELEAFRMEDVLVDKLMTHVAQNTKKKP
jgi:hypothetical protein